MASRLGNEDPLDQEAVRRRTTVDTTIENLDLLDLDDTALAVLHGPAVAGTRVSADVVMLQVEPTVASPEVPAQRIGPASNVRSVTVALIGTTARVGVVQVVGDPDRGQGQQDPGVVRAT